MTTTPVVTIVYVVGIGRSGTTLLSRLLDLEPGYRAVGEVRGLTHNSDLLAERPCGCGAPHFECEFWKSARRRLDEPRSRAAWEAAVWPAKRDQLAGFASPSSPGVRLADSVPELRAVYDSLGAGGATVVDESKNPWLGYLLWTQPWADVRFVELVRPPGDVLRSWSSTKGYQKITPREVVAKHWLRAHTTTALLRRRTRAPWLRLPYAQLVNEPERTLSQILRRPPTGIARVDGEWVFDSPSAHIWQSNSDKLRRGRDVIRPQRTPPAGLAADAGPWERAAHRYWQAWLSRRTSVSQNWSPADDAAAPPGPSAPVRSVLTSSDASATA